MSYEYTKPWGVASYTLSVYFISTFPYLKVTSENCNLKIENIFRKRKMCYLFRNLLSKKRCFPFHNPFSNQPHTLYGIHYPDHTTASSQMLQIKLPRVETELNILTVDIFPT